MPHLAKRVAGLAVMLAFHAALAFGAGAADWPHPGTRSLASYKSFAQLVKATNAAIKKNGMFAVTKASASVEAGIEAPLRFYLTEDGDGTATLTYRTPSAVFARYGSAELDAMAAELDAIFAAIADAAVRG